jgi:hypothetical protein
MTKEEVTKWGWPAGYEYIIPYGGIDVRQIHGREVFDFDVLLYMAGSKKRQVVDQPLEVQDRIWPGYWDSPPLTDRIKEYPAGSPNICEALGATVRAYPPPDTVYSGDNHHPDDSTAFEIVYVVSMNGSIEHITIECPESGTFNVPISVTRFFHSPSAMEDHLCMARSIPVVELSGVYHGLLLKSIAGRPVTASRRILGYGINGKYYIEFEDRIETLDAATPEEYLRD